MKKKPIKSSLAGKSLEKDPDFERLAFSSDAACEMAWRIALTHPQFQQMVAEWMAGGPRSPAEEPSELLIETWEDAVMLAYEFIRYGKVVVGMRAIGGAMRVKDRREKNAAALDALNLSTLTASERESRSVTFRRGCKLVTGLIDGPDAEKRFERIFPAIVERESEGEYEQLDHYREHGFRLYTLGVLRNAWRKLPLEVLRKPYEKSGKYRRNKQGRPRNPKK